MKMVLIGAGQRGRIYADYITAKGYAGITAVAEPDKERRESAASCYGIAADAVFNNADELFTAGKIADAAIIATMDGDHYKQAIAALELGYNLILEKPISPGPHECLEISEKALKLGHRVFVCHVLRYTQFFSEIKKIIDSRELGCVMNICLNENIGNFHFAHSFVRGNWRNMADASPIITQKSCHDMDLLTWFADSPAQQVSSFGNLRYFMPENAPEDSTERCSSCPCRQDCRFDAYKCYLPIAGRWPASAVSHEQTENALHSALDTGPYGRCVFRCDNDVCDSQVVAVQFNNGVTATFCMSGFTNRINRSIRVLCENGEIEGDDGYNTIKVTTGFVSNQAQKYSERIICIPPAGSGHGGGDAGLIDDFFSEQPQNRTDIQQSVESHLMAAAAEESRLQNRSINMQEYRARL